MIEKLEELTIGCMKCGNCKPVCPIFREIGEEAASPRGRVRLIRGVSSGEVELSARYRTLVGMCLNCRACRDECPSGIEPNAAVLNAREHLALEKGLPLAKRAIFRGAMRARRIFPASAKALGLLQRASLIGNPHNPIRLAFPLAGMPRDKYVPYFALKSFLDRTPEVVPVEGRKHRVAYFVGCAANLIFPEIGEAVVGLLNHFGVEVVIPRRQMCCGTPVFNSGDFQGGAYFAKQNIRTFQRLDVDAIIVGCGSCGLAWKQEWRDLLGIEVPEGLSSKVYDITEFLTECLGIEELQIADLRLQSDRSRITHHASRITYHDPCHLARGLGVVTPPRKLIASMPGIEFAEMAEADKCCGAGGTFSLYYPDLSRKVADRKAANVIASEAGIIATGCPVCMIQLRETLARAGSAQQVMHTACLLWKGIQDESLRSRDETE